MEFNIKENLNMELFMRYVGPLKESLACDEVRFWHSISVALTAVSLAEIYGANKDDALVAGLLHDFSKCVPKDQILLECEKHGVLLSKEDEMADGCIHGFLGAKVCKDLFNINDNVYNAIYFHTCGRPNMTMLEKIIYMSDFIEPLRRFRDIVSDIRKLTYENIDAAIIPASEMNLEFLRKHDKFIHTNTIKTLEYYKNIVK